MTRFADLVTQAEMLGFTAHYDADQDLLFADYDDGNGQRVGVGVVGATQADLYGGDWWGNELRRKLATLRSAAA